MNKSCLEPSALWPFPFSVPCKGDVTFYHHLMVHNECYHFCVYREISIFLIT
jgi:hypothetical protein